MSENKDVLIRMNNISKVFLTEEVETHALAQVHLEIMRGEFVAISGPSGCGKSTLLSILGLLDSSTEGSYLLNDKPVAELTLSERARIRNREIGFIFQSFNLIGDLTVYENVELPLTYRRMPAAERKEKVQQALDRVGMAHRMKHYPSQLSGGQQQRVAVARALAGDPLILLADEPTGNLDPDLSLRLLYLFEELNKIGTTVLIATHNKDFVARFKHPVRAHGGMDRRILAVLLHDGRWRCGRCRGPRSWPEIIAGLRPTFVGRCPLSRLLGLRYP